MLASAFLGSGAEPPSPDSVGSGNPVFDWLATDEAMDVKERLQESFPNPQPYNLQLNLMSIGLTASLVEQGSASGSLPDLDSLAVTATERNELLRRELDRVWADCREQGCTFSLEATDSESATFQFSGGPFGTSPQHGRVTVSELGLVQIEDADHPKNWYPDPTGRHELGYWNGTAWTAHVSDRGTTAIDPLG